MDQIISKFIKLPPHVRLVLMLAGIGSALSALYFLFPALRSKEARMWLVIVGLGALAVFGLIALVRRGRVQKRTKSLADSLAQEGPSRADVAEQEKVYRDKFRKKLAALKDADLSVYRLPWIALIGEPGSGKTASLIHSGLDFPLGKEEVAGFGGTRNYNWWFTNDAIILDTAGRIAFHEEGTTDKPEWEYFLKQLRSHRPRCPINGVVIALPADKLLRDPPEERLQKAAILRERLRQIHQALGVRFPAFVIVTKMDLVGGFNEFFEEMRIDLAQRNQMFGWSRPGEFHQPFKTDSFGPAFESVHDRLREWSLRYLQRKATQQEHDMVVTFPESFAQLQEPLNDYIHTIFQTSALVEPPFFRGFYFASAVQEGAPILDVFLRSNRGLRLSEHATRGVDSKSFFIHDFYQQKVFPEHGLVFRSARHAVLNRRLRWLVSAGSVALAACLVGVFALGYSKLSTLVTNPRADAGKAAAAVKSDIAPQFDQLDENLKLAARLEQHAAAYNAPNAALYARMLFIGADIRAPRRDVEAVHARFVLDRVARPTLAAATEKLRTTTLPSDAAARNEYVNSAGALAGWYGAMVGGNRDAPLGEALVARRSVELANLLAFARGGAVDATVTHQSEVALRSYIASPRAFGRTIVGDGARLNADAATEALINAVAALRDDWAKRTAITADTGGEIARYWLEFAARCRRLQQTYAALLNTQADFAAGKLEVASTRFASLTDGVERLGEREPQAGAESLTMAFASLAQFLNDNPPPQENGRIIRLGDLRQRFASQWNADLGLIEQALRDEAALPGAAPQDRVYAALSGARAALDEQFAAALAKVMADAGVPNNSDLLDYFVNAGLLVVSEAAAPTSVASTTLASTAPAATNAPAATIALAPEVFGETGDPLALKNYLTELRELLLAQAGAATALDDLRQWPRLLANLNAETPTGPALNGWLSQLPTTRPPRDNEIIDASHLLQRPVWRPVELHKLTQSVWTAARTNTSSRLLAQMTERCEAAAAAPQLAGVGRMLPGYAASAPDLVFRRDWQRARAVAPPPAVTPKPDEKPTQPPGGQGDRRRRWSGDKDKASDAADQPAKAEAATPAAEPAIDESADYVLLRYHTRQWLYEALRAAHAAEQAVAADRRGEPLKAALRRAAERYVDQYFADWNKLYDTPSQLLDASVLRTLQSCAGKQLDWPKFVNMLRSDNATMASSCASRLRLVFDHAVAWDRGLEQAPADDALAALVDERLGRLKAQQQSLPDRCLAMVEGRPANDPAPENEYGRRITGAWRGYLEQVLLLGDLTQPSSATDLPNLDRLRTDIVFPGATSVSDPLIQPLVRIAEYGNALLAHQVDSRLASIFARVNGRFPVISPEAARDPSPGFSRLAGMSTLTPAELVQLLQEVSAFRAQYGALLAKTTRDPSVQRTLDQCDAWAKFLYRDPGAMSRGAPPERFDVAAGWVLSPPGSVLAPGSVYVKAVVQMPVLDANGGASAPLQFETRTGSDVRQQNIKQCLAGVAPQFSWRLADSGFPASSAKLTDRLAETPDYPAEVSGWVISRGPWSLLMMIGARAEADQGGGFYGIPVELPTPRGNIGFTVAIRFGDGTNPYPGPIPPLQLNATAPAMPDMVGMGRGTP